MIKRSPATTTKAPTASVTRVYTHRWALFLVIGLGLYILLYTASEMLVHQYGQRNPFFVISTTPTTQFDFVILGASHALPLVYEDMNEHLQTEASSRIVNLALEGGGVLPGMLLLDYFLRKHTTDNVVYIVDSFAFYDEQWNEERLTAAEFLRAPLDLDLIKMLIKYPWARHILGSYLSAFNKINNPKRFSPDISEAESSKFHRVYRPIAQIDRQRISFLYPDDFPENQVAVYLDSLAELSSLAEQHGARLILIRPPIPPRVVEMLPHEDRFIETLEAFVDENRIAYQDLSSVVPDEAHYYDTDHLNRTGALTFITNHLGPSLARIKDIGLAELPSSWWEE